MSGFWHIQWIMHQASLIVFILVILGIAVSNLVVLRRRKLGRYPLPLSFPKVSVMVPARNEEASIGPCVESLLAQDYPDFEVIVLDDHSTDGTWQVLERLESNPRLKPMKGRHLPPGWFGKHWACHQMTEAATGELFLFTDADTRHHPSTLRDAVAALLTEDADLLTSLPHEEAKTLSEKLIIPLMPFAIFSFLPLFIAHRLNRPASLSATIGQFMLFKRSAFEQIGAYPSIKTKQVDDMALGQRIRRLGFRWRFTDGQDRISCRMYSNFREVFVGFGKTVFAAFNRNVPLFAFVWLWLFTIFWEPLAVFVIRLTGGPITDTSIWLAAGAVFLSLILWGLTLWRFRFPLWLTPLYPLSFMLALTMAFYSIISVLLGRATWKGRKL